MSDHAYVALLDILGYRGLLENDIKAGTHIFKDRMTRAFRVFENINQSKYSYRAISDSIFITCTDRAAATELLELLRNVYSAFLSEGLLIRGGVSFGPHFQNQFITYSPTLTKAHFLESRTAEFPRIIIDTNILDMFADLATNALALKCGDSWFLNIATSENFHQLWGYTKIAHAANIDAIHSSERVRMKYRWLQDFLIEICDRISVSKPDPFLGIFDDP